MIQEASAPTNFDRTRSWLHACGKEPGNEQHLSVQIGCCLEEVCELLRAINLSSPTGISSVGLQEVAAVLSAIAGNLKAGHATAPIYDREAVLDALCDIEVTLNGVAYLAMMDKEEADRRVLDSNDSKLGPDGKPVLLPGGKIGKGPNYAPPDLDGLW